MRFPKNMEEFEEELLKAFRSGMIAGYRISHRGNVDSGKDELDAAISFCEECGMINYGRFVYPPQFSIPEGYVYENNLKCNENKSITLHIKYREPIRLNGFFVETDKIIFGTQEELNNYIKGENAYDFLDNSVKKRDNEILLYAEDETGNVIWKGKEEPFVEKTCSEQKANAIKRRSR